MSAPDPSTGVRPPGGCLVTTGPMAAPGPKRSCRKRAGSVRESPFERVGAARRCARKAPLCLYIGPGLGGGHMTVAKRGVEAPVLKRKHIAAATIGNALEFYDFLTYAFFSIQIGHAFFPTQSAYGSLMLSLATFGAGFVTRPLGAMVIGSYSDRVGRKPALMLCFVLIG